MIILAFDTENTGAQVDNANPHNPNNRCCILSYVVHDTDNPTERIIKTIELDYVSGNSMYAQPEIDELQGIIDTAEWVVLFNAKYDINWAVRYGIDVSKKKLWDCQLFHYISRAQSPYPSLNGVCEEYGLSKKLDIVATEYWDVGLDTDNVPLDILTEYCEMDVLLTLDVFFEQAKEFREFSRKLKTVIRTSFDDLHGLAMMERNGFMFNHNKCQEHAKKCQEDIENFVRTLTELCNIPNNIGFNFNSGRHISALLFGGKVPFDVREPYTFTYKDPKKEPVTKYRTVTYTHEFGAIFTPCRGTETKTTGVFQTDVAHLRKLKAKSKFQKTIIESLLGLSAKEKLLSTYYNGFPAKIEKSSWGDILHTQLSQVTVATGRLASTGPNLQNVAGDVKVLMVSRFRR